MARKTIVWTEKEFQQFESLCGLFATKEDICRVLKVSEKTLSKLVKAHYHMDYLETVEMLRAVGRVSLLRDQRVLAKRSSNMAIWLGKQYLDQREPAQEIRQLEGAETNDVTNIPIDWVRAVEATGDVAIPPELKEIVNAEKESE